MALTRLNSPEAAARWLKSWVTGTLRSDSRQVRPGDAFIAWPGYAHDGRRYAKAALDAGAATVLVEDDGVQAFGFEDARIATLARLKAVTGRIASEYFDRPSDALDVVAVTGTNGKTSSAWWTAQALTLLGRDCGVVGTLGIGRPPLQDREGDVRHTGLTTPDPVMLHASLRRFADAGFKACAMEASSIGIVEHRLDGVNVAVALFTNFTRDHLDYHGTMEAYWTAKHALFGWPGLRAAVVNVDDAQGEALANEVADRGLDLWTYSTRSDARLRAGDVRYVDGALAFSLHEAGDRAEVRSMLIGDYNTSNLLGVIGGLRALGVSLQDAAGAVAHLTPVPGRMQRVIGARGPEVVVDYAHTPDALEKAIAALRPLAAARGGRLWCVFGCGGNRDATKRPLMGAIAARLADRVVVTSDNPRDEAPSAILAHIVAGIERKYILDPQSPAAPRPPEGDRARPSGGRAAELITGCVAYGDEPFVFVTQDRRQAIRQSIATADARDVVLIAGKGHEDYQEIAGVKHPFSDIEEANAALAEVSP